jgi:hypothetical protein
MSYRSKNKRNGFRVAFICFGTLLIAAVLTSVALMAPLSGAIFTTNSACNGTNLNIYASKLDVYIDGGPTHPGAAGLVDGYYYVRVTEPNGTLLGTSVGSGNDTPVHVTGGEFDTCYQLWNILRKASDSSQGYDSTSNPGGEYKVWVSTDASFTNDSTKTDNFKVNENCTGDCNPDERATLHVRKYYDANANGVKDSGEPLLTGWKFRIQDDIDLIRFTPVDLIVDPDIYAVTEFLPLEPNWINTDPGGTAPFLKTVTLNNGDEKTLYFGNVCLGPGGGLTLGFWSNKNGLSLINQADLCYLSGLCLRNANGSNFDPLAASYCPGSASNSVINNAKSALSNWLLSATATNMANMLSAQLTAMELNVRKGKVSSTAIIYAPGTVAGGASGFATVRAILAEAEAELCAHPDTTTGGVNGSFRSYQEALKNALDKANNNLNFVQGTPCPFSFEN